MMAFAPASAVALLDALGATFDPPCYGADLFRQPYSRADRHNRHLAWKALRDEEDERGRKRYSLGEIGAWFGVERHTVCAAVKRLDGSRD